MANRKRKIARKEGSRRHFLLSQADTRRLEEAPEYGADRVRDLLAATFPDLLWGTGLRGACAKRLKTVSRFAAMAVRQDEAPGRQLPLLAGPDPGPLLEVANGLDRVCRDIGGFWGIEDHGLPAGFLPGCGAAEGLAAAKAFQQELRERTGCTLTVGVAVHPTLDYAVHETVVNARKAADHATFFGPGSCAAFDAVSLNISGDKCFEHGDTEAAIREFQRALALDPANVNVRNSLGVCYAVLGDYEEALQQFAAAVSLDRREYMAIYNIGLVHWLLGRKEAALDHLLQANALRGEVFEILFQIGKLQLDMHQPHASRENLEHASRLRTKSGGIYRYLGDCYAALDLSEKAIAAYKKAIKFNSSDPAALSALGCLFDGKAENPDISLMFCRESVKLAPENPLFRHRLGALCLKQNRLADALEHLEAAARLGRDTAGDIRRVRERMEGRH
ncbi:MAG: tetratricopeptide repeat protein [Deltaproteobacteria bacterium]|nr:tetratricopeptide repeat protein [Deltaproteobacteria bacterium]